MSKRLAILPCLSISLLLAACAGDSGTSPTPPGSGSIEAAWKLTAHTVTPAVDLNMDGVMVTDILNAEGACAKDNITTFKAGGTWTEDDGAAKCDPTDPQTVSGTWTQNAAKDSLEVKVTGFPFPLDYKVQEVTATSLKLVIVSEDWGDDGPYTETWTYTRQ